LVAAAVGYLSFARGGPKSEVVLPAGSISNANAGNLSEWLAASAHVRRNAGRARVVFIGDSTTAGLGAGPSLYEGAKAGSWPTQLADLLDRAGLPSHSASFFGDSGFLSHMEVADPRIELGSGWTLAASVITAGGYPFIDTTTTEPITFLPGVTADTLVVYDVPQASSAAMNVTIDDAPLKSIKPEGSPAGRLRRTTVRFPFEVDPAIDFAPEVNGGAFAGTELVGMDVYDSTAADVALWNLGFSGSTTSQWIGHSPISPLAVVAELNPDLTFVSLGINDLGANVPVETYRQNIRAIVMAANRTGDVVLVVPNEIDPRAAPFGRQRAYERVLADLAREFDLPVINLPVVFGEFRHAKAAGYMFDGVHPSADGYRRIAQAAALILLGKTESVDQGRQGR
jgi:lysophospholipase L1-like esterase